MFALFCIVIACLGGIYILIFWNSKRMPTDQDVNNKLNELNRLHLERNNKK